MVTVMTDDECIQFNLKDNDTEKIFVSALKYHMKNQTGKHLKVNSIQFNGGEKIIHPEDVVSVGWEDRKYDTSIGHMIDQLINSI